MDAMFGDNGHNASRLSWFLHDGSQFSVLVIYNLHNLHNLRIMLTPEYSVLPDLTNANPAIILVSQPKTAYWRAIVRLIYRTSKHLLLSKRTRFYNWLVLAMKSEKNYERARWLYWPGHYGQWYGP